MKRTEALERAVERTIRALPESLCWAGNGVGNVGLGSALRDTPVRTHLFGELRIADIERPHPEATA